MKCTCILVREQRQLFGAEPLYIRPAIPRRFCRRRQDEGWITPDYESAFIRSLLESSGARVLNAFSDDERAFQKALKRRCGQRAREYEVTDSSDVVCFFPSLSSEVVATAARRELQDPLALEAGHLQPIKQPYRRPQGFTSLRWWRSSLRRGSSERRVATTQYVRRKSGRSGTK
jgi:hypothetical protein